jgi:hypothetical protein
MRVGQVYVRPGVTQAMELLGKWVACRIRYADEAELRDIEPAQVVGVVVPALGGPVEAQLLLNSRPWVACIEGYELEVFLDTVVHIHVVPPARPSASLA